MTVNKAMEHVIEIAKHRQIIQGAMADDKVVVLEELERTRQEHEAEKGEKQQLEQQIQSERAQKEQLQQRCHVEKAERQQLEQQNQSERAAKEQLQEQHQAEMANLLQQLKMVQQEKAALSSQPQRIKMEPGLVPVKHEPGVGDVVVQFATRQKQEVEQQMVECCERLIKLGGKEEIEIDWDEVGGSMQTIPEGSDTLTQKEEIMGR